MASRRSLGGGRVLGSGKGLAPPAPAPAISIPPKQVQATRNTGLLSPSESSVSLNSQASSTPITDHEDLTSRIALDEQGSAQAAAAASSRMVCPICNEEMVTLLQLNRHIDDNHANLEVIEQDEAKTWFKSQMTKAKKFQPLALINQKLRGLEVFESNDELLQAVTAVTGPPPVAEMRGGPAAALPAKEEEPPNPDEVVTRTHWQRPRVNDACADPMCGRRLGAQNGQINCRHCGKLFCEEHTMYQMKLSRSAQHEPVRGLWCRVCETCYKSRPGYLDNRGFERDHTEFLKSARRKTVDKKYLETSRLETRLTRLTQLLANPPPAEQTTTSMLWSSFAGNKPQIRALEQSVVPWEDDATVAACPFCHQPFSQYTMRRHHCRICGRVVCGDPATSCSSEIGLDVDLKKAGSGEGKVSVDVRMCKDCNRTIFSKADFARELSTQTPLQRAYQNLISFEHGIRLMLPKFQRILIPLQDPDNPPSSNQIAEAGKIRKRLTDAFTQYDVAARRVRDMDTGGSPTQERLQKAIYLQATNFLHIHMLPLKSLPKIMKHANPSTSSSLRPSTPTTPNGHLRPPHLTNGSSSSSPLRPDHSRTSSASSAAITALEAEEKELKERLMVLEEQQFFVKEMIADAGKRRKYDEVSALTRNAEDLGREVDALRGELEGMEGQWRGVYEEGLG
ncbi:uncharacterized protein MYCGRDRAFT_48386 [Zymoseptoria tritici IPO323]|uniref:FYVE-type domain-containing protein n=1 Tax=Zymoseptoria tritici (strain CBS 115943 / IPO323) TaxID=336722 RepID=F9XLX1_ZYMTI|nr:uncharacterized protein MYCGRDRAFT_48386 [Zymoseptoria tritici IPO323]EGP83938.1 hypothetical protein MYCGRDRAFT_48386 [Zymoseptoria tritici IPO323]